MRLARIFAAATALLVVSPLIGLLVGLVNPPPDPYGMPIPSLAELLTRSRALQLLANSVILSVAVSVCAVLSGGWLAWAEQRLDYPGRRGLGVLSLLPLASPSYLVAATMAAELKADVHVAKRAGLLHDIGKAIDYEREGTHPEIGAEVTGRLGEDDRVVNAVASHHEDCEMTSPYAVLVSAADSLSGARPGARRKTVAEYIKRKTSDYDRWLHGMRRLQDQYLEQQ